MEVDSAPAPVISTNHKSEDEVSTNHVEDAPDKPVKPDISVKKPDVTEKVSTNHTNEEDEPDAVANHNAIEETNHSNGREETNHVEEQKEVVGEEKTALTNHEAEDAVSTNHKETGEEPSANHEEAEAVVDGPEAEEEIDPLATNGEAEPRDLQPTIEGCVTVVIDIAGTSAPIDYVKDTLFAYVIANAETFLRSNWEKESIVGLFPARDIDEAIRFVVDGTKGGVDGKKGQENGEEGAKEEVAVGDGVDDAVKDCKDAKEEGDKAVVQDEESSKAKDDSLLKKIQGMILREGFKNGDLEAKLFPDVAPSIRDWSMMGRRVSVYSTGSVESQRLLFSHAKLPSSKSSSDVVEEQEKDKMADGVDEASSDSPSSYIREYLDTENVGPKTEASSYKKVLEVVRSGPEETLFITDDVKEAKAAKSAGLVVFLIERAGNPKLPEGHGFPVIESFKEIIFKTRKEVADKMVQTMAVATEKKEAPPPPVKEADQPSDAATAIKKDEEMEKTEPMEELKEKDSKSDEKTEVKEEETSKMADDEKMDEDEESRKRKREEVAEEGEKAKEEKRKREEGAKEVEEKEEGEKKV